MKRLISIALLVVLIFIELYMCSGFLPPTWQHTINEQVSRALPKQADWTPITHPALSEEIEQVLRDHLGFRIVLYGITFALLLGNGWLILRLVRFLWRGPNSKSADT